MKFYRVIYSADGGNSGGFSWHTSKAEAEKAVREAVKNDPKEYEVDRSGRPAIEVIEVQPTKQDILALLQCYANHPDNG